MTAFLIVLAVAAEAYLLGSVDTGILPRHLYHDDVRHPLSGRAGMTNMLRTFGKKAAALTAVGDVLKGVVAVCLGRWLFGHLPADAAVSPYLGVYLAATRRWNTKPTTSVKGVRRAGCRCHSGSPAGAAASAGTHLPRLPGPHRAGRQHHHGRGLPGADAGVQPHARPADSGRGGLHRRRCHHGRHGHLDAPFQHPAHPGRARCTVSARSTRAIQEQKCPAGSSQRALCGAFAVVRLISGLLPAACRCCPRTWGLRWRLKPKQ